MLPVLRAVVYETVLGAVLVLVPLALALELFPGAPILPEWGQLAGFALALGGGVLWLWATAALVFLGRGTPFPLDPPRQLVVAGPYRWIRNPMHLGLAAFLIGEGLLFRSLPLTVFALVVAAALVFWEGRREERELDARFGERYARYREAVPAWLPRWGDVRRRAGGLGRRRRRPAAEPEPPIEWDEWGPR